MKLVEIEGFYVEVSEPASAVEPTAGGELSLERTGARAEAVAERVKELRSTIAGVCGYVRSAFSHATHPDELKVTFGIKLAGEMGVPFVSRGSGEASILVEATWKNAPAKPPTPGE